MNIKYTFIKTIGQGNFGTVKLARQNSTGLQWAVKVLNKNVLQESDKQERVLKEIKILKMVSHPHVIKLCEVIDTPGSINLVMEYVEWGNLLDYVLDYDPVPEDTVRMFFQQLISGVEHIHFLRVVHRDLKLDNILVDRACNLKIADFGLSSGLCDGSFLWTSCGTPNYAAPELVAGRLYAGPEVDVWSCGVILYAMLTGTLPFDDDSVAALFQKIQRGRYEAPERGSSGAIQLVEKMLVVDQVMRITISEIRESSWFRVGLPDHLAVSPEEHHLEEDQCKWDQQVVEYMTKRLGMSQDIVHRLLSLGGSSEVARTYSTMVAAKKKKLPPLQSNPLIDGLVAWDRLAERRIRQTYNDLAPSTPQWRLYHSHLPMASPVCKPSRPPAAAADMPFLSLSPSSPQLSSPSARQLFENEGDSEASSISQSWRLGLFTQLDSHVIMKKLYAMLKEEQLKWKVVDFYKLQCRALDGTEDLVSIHLYRMCAGESSFIVDLSILHPNMLEYLGLVHRLYNRMLAVL